MKKVLIVANAASMIHLFNERNIQLFLDNGYQVHIACNFLEGNTTSLAVIEKSRKRWESLGIVCHQVSFLRTPFSFKQISIYRQIKKIINEHAFEIIHCHTPITSILTRLAARKSRRRGTKVIYTAHGFHFYKGAPLLNWLIFFTSEWLCSFMTDVLLTMNGEDFKRAKKYLRAKVTGYIPGVGIDISDIPQHEIDKTERLKEFGVEQQTVLLSIGELSNRKNHEIILRALSKVDKPFKYIICGQGEKKDYLENMTKALGIADKVVFAGFRTDIQEILTCADIFCFPSYQEGLSMALMEAMTAKLPVIASDIRGNVDLIDDAKGGLLFAPDDADGFANGIAILLDNPSMREAFGQYNYEKVHQFTTEIVDEKMKAFYFGDLATAQPVADYDAEVEFVHN